MFGKIKNAMDQLKMMQQLMKDDNFKAFISHPKVQAMLKDSEFQQLIKQQNWVKLGTHPKLAALMKDPEVAPLMAKIDPKALFQASA